MAGAAPTTFSAPIVRDLSDFKINANQPKVNNGNIVTRNLSTIGGIAAPIIATALAPETGGLSLAALAALGAAGGRVATNASTGQKLTKDVGTSAVQGATGEVGGQILGKGASFLSKAVTSPIDKAAGNLAEKKAAQATVAEQAPFVAVPKGVRETQNLNGAIDNAKNLGLAPTPQNFALAAQHATGAEGQGTVALQTALDGHKVDVGSYLSHVKDAINSQPLLGAAEAKAGPGADLLRSITNNKEGNLFDGKGSLTQQAAAPDVLKAIQYHEGQAARFGASAPGTPGEAIGQVHKAASDYLKGGLESHPGINKSISDYKFSPEDHAALSKDITAQGGTPQLADHIVQNINDAKNVGDLRSFQAPFVQMSKLAGAADKTAGGAIAKAPSEAGGNGFGGLSTTYEGASALHGNPVAAGILLKKAAGTEPFVEKATGALDKARSVNNALPGGVTAGGIISRGITQSSTQKLPAAPAADGSVPASNDPSKLIADAAASLHSPGANAAAPTNDPFDQGHIQNAIAQDIQLHGGKHVQELISLYNTFGKTQDGLTTNQKNEVVGQQKALDALQTYITRLQGAGGGEGPIKGAIDGSILGNYTNPQARALDSQRIDIASAIAGSLNPRGTVSPTTARLIADALPTVRDSQGVAAAKINGLIKQIQSGSYSAETPVNALAAGAH